MPKTRPSRPPSTCDHGFPWNPLFPYDNLPPVPAAAVLTTPKVRAHCERARTALDTLRDGARTLSDPDALLQILPTIEAHASSAIENITTTVAEMIRKVDLPTTADPHTAEALRHYNSILDAHDRRGAEPVGTALAIRACSRTKNMRMPIRRGHGTVIAGPRGIVYTPPVGDGRINDMLDTLWSFMHEQDAGDPLIRMAAGHHQFESIHPFADGNGRTGRLINTVYLSHQKLTDLPILCHSRYILRHRQQYYRLLQQTRTSNDWEPWITWMLDGVRNTAEWISSTLQRQAGIAQTTVERYTEQHPKAGIASDTIRFACTRAYCRSTDLVRAGHAKSTSSALGTLRRLTAAGILEEWPGHTPTLFVNSRTLALWTDTSE